MKCDAGQRRAYLDDALLPSGRADMAAHLARCESCRVELAAQQARRETVATQLDALGPSAGQVTIPAQALARFRAEHRQSQPGLWATLQRRLTMHPQTWFSNRWRPAAIGVAAVVIVAILFSFAPIRQAAADFLGLFRVRKFAVIPIDPAQTQRLEELARLADATAFGEPTIVREAGTPWEVADAAEATGLAGFPVRSPSRLPHNAILQRFAVETGPALHFEVDRATLEAVLAAAGVPAAPLPQTETIAFDLDLGTMATQEYNLGAGHLLLTQMLSPEVAVPPGIDPVALGEMAFQFLGMPAEDARRLAQTIDWTSTLVIPLPTDIAQSREVTVDGVSGLLLQDTQPRRSNGLLVWEREGMLYALNGQNVDLKLLLDTADSLR